MTKFKKLMALAAVSMLGIQIMGAGTAFAAGESDCDFGSDNLEITIDMKDVEIRLNDGILECDDDASHGSFSAVTDSLPIASVDSITVEMNDDDSTGDFYVDLEDGTTADAAEWESVDTFDVDITTTFYVSGDGITDDTGDRLSIKFGASTFSFSGISGTYAAHELDLEGGDDKDLIDASKATVKVTADGNGEDDVIKGGTKNDTLTDNSDEDVIYGNGGNDVVSATGGQAWGGDGSDDLTGAVVAPGAGDDDVVATVMVTYADLSDGVEVSDDGTDVTTAGAAGDDDLGSSGAFPKLDGSQGDDVLVFVGTRVRGNGGDDVIKCDGCIDDGSGLKYASGGAGDDLLVEYDVDYQGGGDDNLFYGNAGNDVLRGRDGDDTLRGGPGNDQAWGGSGPEDTCTAEVLNRCEFIKH